MAREHHVIIVTGAYEDWIDKAHRQASKIFKQVSPIIPSYEKELCRTFFVPPDGADLPTKSHEGRKRRDEFIKWLESQRYDDGSSPLALVEVQYGDTLPEEPMVRRHSPPG
jgi:hypothetical protein